MRGSDAPAATADLTLATQATCLHINIQTLLCIPKDRQTKNRSLKPRALEGFPSLHAGTAPLSPVTEQRTTAASVCPYSTYCSKGHCAQVRVTPQTWAQQCRSSGTALPKACKIHTLPSPQSGWSEPHQHIQFPKISYQKCTGKAFKAQTKLSKVSQIGFFPFTTRSVVKKLCFLYSMKNWWVKRTEPDYKSMCDTCNHCPVSLHGLETTFSRLSCLKRTWVCTWKPFNWCVFKGNKENKHANAKGICSC